MTWTKVSACCSSPGPEGVCACAPVCVRTCALTSTPIPLAVCTRVPRRGEDPAVPASVFCGPASAFTRPSPFGFREDTRQPVVQFLDPQGSLSQEGSMGARPPEAPPAPGNGLGPRGAVVPGAASCSPSATGSELPWPRAAVQGKGERSWLPDSVRVPSALPLGWARGWVPR